MTSTTSLHWPTGTPGGYYGGAYLDITGGHVTNTHLRASHARTAIKSAANLTVRHAQFLNCSNAFDQIANSSQPRLTLENVLLYGIQNVAVLGVVDSVGYFTGTHLTINSCGMLTTNTTGAFDWVGELHNSIIYGLTGWGGEEPSLNACHTDLLAEDTYPFQTVGAAAHYLAVGSELRDEGSALTGALADEIKKRTTWPPIVISNQLLNSDLTLTPQAQRDQTLPDLGYHYDPIDFALGQATLSNAVLTAGSGVVIATFAPAYAKPGIALVSNASFLGEGSPTNLNRVVRYNTVQEQVNAIWTNQPGPQVQAIDSATVRVRFTGFSGAAQDSTHFSGDETSGGSFPFRDCEFGGGRIAGLMPDLHFTNCLFQRVNHELSSYNSPFNVSYQNCLFHGGRLSLEDGGGGIGLWAFHNNFFAGTTNLTNGVLVTNSHNAYTTNLALLVPTAATNVLLATNAIAFDAGPLGFFYLPTNGPATNLFNAGSTYATNVGLYHFTTTTNQWKETNSIVDISFHYIALGTNGLPVDTDSDGLPDYVEDANGNGSLDHRETKPNDAADRGLRVFITRPRTGSTIP